MLRCRIPSVFHGDNTRLVSRATDQYGPRPVAPHLTPRAASLPAGADLVAGAAADADPAAHLHVDDVQLVRLGPAVQPAAVQVGQRGARGEGCRAPRAAVLPGWLAVLVRMRGVADMCRSG